MLWLLGFVVCGVLVGDPPRAQAQVLDGTAATSLTSEDRAARVVFRPSYHRFDDDRRSVGQWSVPVDVIVPFGERWTLNVRGGGARASVEGFPALSGPTDVQAALGYARPVGDGSLVARVTVNAPTGKTELTREEFIAATFLSQNFYRFPVSSFGQGVSTGASLTWATPVSESVVLGLGGAFQYHRRYDPVAERPQQYNPGEEGRLSAGVDVQLTRVSAVSTDLSLFLYGTDTLGGVDQFTAGNHASVRVQYLRQADETTLRIVGHYRQQEKSTLPFRSGSTRTRQVLPSQGTVRGRYAIPLSDVVSLRVSAAGRWYGETAAFESKRLVTLGGGIGIKVQDGFKVSPRAEYTTGTFTGLGGSLSLRAEL